MAWEGEYEGCRRGEQNRKTEEFRENPEEPYVHKIYRSAGIEIRIRNHINDNSFF